MRRENRWQHPWSQNYLSNLVILGIALKLKPIKFNYQKDFQDSFSKFRKKCCFFYILNSEIETEIKKISLIVKLILTEASSYHGCPPKSFFFTKKLVKGHWKNGFRGYSSILYFDPMIKMVHQTTTWGTSKIKEMFKPVRWFLRRPSPTFQRKFLFLWAPVTSFDQITQVV